MSLSHHTTFASIGEIVARQILPRLRHAQKLPLRISCIGIASDDESDDVGGFENAGQGLDGGLAVTGNYPGKARTADQLRGDLDQALALIPGTHRLNLHACYAETGGRRVDRNEMQADVFCRWIEWCKAKKMGMDFNSTFFSHPKAASGLTLSHPDKGIRQFWVEHGIACRKIGAEIGRQLGKTCVTNVWIPDGY